MIHIRPATEADFAALLHVQQKLNCFDRKFTFNNGQKNCSFC